MTARRYDELDMQAQAGRDILNFTIDANAFDSVCADIKASFDQLSGGLMIPAEIVNAKPERATATEIDHAIRRLGR